MRTLTDYTLWFVTGSQHLYGPETLAQVETHARQIAESLGEDGRLSLKVIFKPILTGPDAIRDLCRAANADDTCAGLITWMHTFSPAKMWIGGLAELRKPLLHLHTQFHRDIPWDSLDMDFMNLNQSAHGDREFGFIGARMGITRRVVVGHWADPAVRQDFADWARVAAASVAGRSLKVARFGDNMREVAVTEGDKVAAQLQFGWSINGYGVGDLVQRMHGVSDADVQALMAEYADLYTFAPSLTEPGPGRDRVQEQARIELALRGFLTDGGFSAFTTTFEDLHGLPQLPGLAAQRLMADGFGFAGEGDWKTAALVRQMKFMADGLPGGTSFMEDYTYHLEPGHESVLGAHMLEICPTIAAGRPSLEVHPLGIGGKADPARLVFDGAAGPALVATLVDMGTRFRMIVNPVTAVAPAHPMPKLPVARVLWHPEPSLRVSATCWILAGGAHHTGYSQALSVTQMTDWAELSGIECLVIDNATTPRAFQDALRWNAAAWK
jgi:L-arabinose isomerase